jgi:hypothetical protein
LFRRTQPGQAEDILKPIELPMSMFVVGIPVLGVLVVWLAHALFGVAIWQGVVAIPLILVFTLIGVNSTALTSIERFPLTHGLKGCTGDRQWRI